jgi:hypothetical protein
MDYSSPGFSETDSAAMSKLIATSNHKALERITRVQVAFKAEFISHTHRFGESIRTLRLWNGVNPCIAEVVPGFKIHPYLVPVTSRSESQYHLDIIIFNPSNKEIIGDRQNHLVFRYIFTL